MESDTPEMVCSGCGDRTEITDPTDMPPFYCPECGSRRSVELHPSDPENTKTDRV